MDTRSIGSLRVSVVGLGCNNFGNKLDERASIEVVHAALDAGITLLDTADIYAKGRSEEFIGRALGTRRNEVILATKFGKPMDETRRGSHPDYIRRAVEDSLRRLGTDYIDLYQVHEFDEAVPADDVLGALDDLVRAGKVREIGCSNYTVAQVRDADASAKKLGSARFVSVQNEYSLLEREPERGMLDECARIGAAFVPYYPLAAGLLTGKYRLGEAPPAGSKVARKGGFDDVQRARLARVEELRVFAESRGHTLLELAFSWLLTKPVVASVIAGATTPAQVAANVQAAGWKLSEDEVRAAARASVR